VGICLAQPFSFLTRQQGRGKGDKMAKERGRREGGRRFCMIRGIEQGKRFGLPTDEAADDGWSTF